MNYLEINKNLWDKKTEIHYQSEFYDVESFIKGKSSLNSIELELLGDVKDKKILHLQCHFGQDSISLTRMGAQVTAVDLSPVALKIANELNKTCGTDVRFIESDVLTLDKVLNETFDVVFTSYGVVGWHPDTEKWADIISQFLNSDGQFVMAEFHPVVWMFSYDFSKVEYDYLNTGLIVEELEGTYTDQNSEIKESSVSWNHGLSEVINPLLKLGLSLDTLLEFDYSPYNCFQNTVEVEEGKFQIKGLEGKLPMIYALKATKKG